MSNSLWPHGLYSLWNSPDQNIGVGSLSLLQGIFPTQGLNLGLPRCGRILYQLSRKGSPKILEWVAYPFSRGSSQPRSRTGASCIAGRFFANWAMKEVHMPREVLVGFQISWGHAGLSECKLFSFRRTFSRAFHLLCLKNYLFIYWKLVGLQCCVNFSCIAKWFRYTHTFSFFFLIGYYKILSIVPCAIQYVLVGYLILYTVVCYMLIPNSLCMPPLLW